MVIEPLFSFDVQGYLMSFILVQADFTLTQVLHVIATKVFLFIIDLIVSVVFVILQTSFPQLLGNINIARFTHFELTSVLNKSPLVILYAETIEVAVLANPFELDSTIVVVDNRLSFSVSVWASFEEVAFVLLVAILMIQRPITFEKSILYHSAVLKVAIRMVDTSFSSAWLIVHKVSFVLQTPIIMVQSSFSIVVTIFNRPFVLKSRVEVEDLTVVSVRLSIYKVASIEKVSVIVVQDPETVVLVVNYMPFVLDFAVNMLQGLYLFTAFFELLVMVVRLILVVFDFAETGDDFDY